MRSLRTLVSTSVALFVVAAPGLALASPTYPGLITSDLSLDYTLGNTDCIICHLTNAGGATSAVQPFALAMRDAGLDEEDPPALAAALNTLATRGDDSDCIEMSDIAQLKAGRDPNNGTFLNGGTGGSCAGSMTTSEGPAFGCGARIAAEPTPPPWRGATALLAGLAAAVLARRKVRSRLSGR